MFAEWEDVRSKCTNELAVHFSGAGTAGGPLSGDQLLRAPAFQATPPWMGVPYEKRWAGVAGGRDVSANYSLLHAKLMGVIQKEVSSQMKSCTGILFSARSFRHALSSF